MHGIVNCSELLYIWGAADLTADPPIIQNIASMGCNMGYKVVYVFGSFLGPDFHIDQEQPPYVVEGTARNSGIVRPYAPVKSFAFNSSFTSRNRLDVYSNLEPKSQANGLADKFFSTLTTSPWGIPASYLVNLSTNHIAAEAIKHQHGILAAQILAWQRIPATESNSMSFHPNKPGANDTDKAFQCMIEASHQGRIVQNASSTRILQAMICVSLALLIVSWLLTRPVLATNPTSIASAAALLARGNVLEIFPAPLSITAERGSLEKIAKGMFPPGTRFRMGWTGEAPAATAAITGTGNSGIDGPLRVDRSEDEGEPARGERFGIIAEEYIN